MAIDLPKPSMPSAPTAPTTGPAESKPAAPTPSKTTAAPAPTPNKAKPAAPKPKPKEKKTQPAPEPQANLNQSLESLMQALEKHFSKKNNDEDQPAPPMAPTQNAAPQPKPKPTPEPEEKEEMKKEEEEKEEPLMMGSLSDAMDAAKAYETQLSQSKDLNTQLKNAGLKDSLKDFSAAATDLQTSITNNLKDNPKQDLNGLLKDKDVASKAKDLMNTDVVKDAMQKSPELKAAGEKINTGLDQSLGKGLAKGLAELPKLGFGK